MKPLDKPLLMKVSSHHDIEIDDTLGRHLDDLAFVQRRYERLPGLVSDALQKVLSYRGRNAFWLWAGSFIRWLMSIDLRVRGRARAAPLLVQGLRLGQHSKQQAAAVQHAAETEYGSGVGYASERDDLAIAQRYKAWLAASAHFPTEEERLGTQFYFSIHNTTRFLRSRPDIRRLVDFGACYGINDHGIAVLNPGVEVFGVDRAAMVKDFNDGEFQAPNLHYVAADIFDFIEGAGDLSDCAFLFMRTAFIFPEPFMVRLMTLLAGHRIAAIIGIEPFGYSLTERRVPELSTEPRPSVRGRGGMWLHNYPSLVSMAGLRIIEEQWLCPMERTGDHKDAERQYCFIAA